MKILILQDDFPPVSFGGAGIATFNFTKELKKNGHNIVILTTTQYKGKDQVIEYDGLKIHKIYSKFHERWRAYLSLYNPQTIKKARKIIAEFKPDVIYVNNIHHYLSYHCLKIAKQSGAKVFLTAHDVMIFHYGKLTEFINPKDLSCPKKFNYKISPWQQIKKYKWRYNPFRNIVIKHYLKYVDKIFAVSGALKEALNQNGIKNVEVLHNGINLDDWITEDSEVKKFKEKYYLNDKKIVLFGGRLSEAKGGYQAISTMAEVIKKIPDAVLLIMGEKNSYAEKMLDFSKNLKIESHLIFTGWITGDELKSAYYASSIVIVPSIYCEPFGLICLEAMLCRKPIVATCFGGPPDIVLSDKSGYIINPYDIPQMALSIIVLLSDIIKATEFGKAGYNRAVNDFNLTQQVNKFLTKII